MILGEYGPTLVAWLLAHWPELANGAFVSLVANVQIGAARAVIEQESVAGPAARIVRLYFAWTLFTVWYFYFLQQPISSAMYAVLGAAQLFFLLACWVYGPFNYERRLDRFRWRIVKAVRRVRDPIPADFWGPEDAKPPRATHADLPVKWCATCDADTRHDLDGHCIVCDRGPV